jgi:hypothetical protein
MALSDKLAEMLRLNDGDQAYVGYPQMQVGMNKPRQAGYATGFLEGASGADSMQPKNPITDPNYDQYAQGKNIGEAVGIGAMAIPAYAMALRAGAPKAAQMVENHLRDIGGIADVVPVGPNRIPSNEILFPNRTLASLNSAEKSALTKFDKDLQNKAVMRREILRSQFEDLGPQGQRITPLVEKRILTPQDLLDKQIVAFGGDQMRAGVEFDKIRGVPLSKKVLGQGGDEYAFLEPNYNSNTAWGSNVEAASGHTTNIDKAFETGKGRDVLAIKAGMNPEGANFSHPITQALVRQLEVLKPKKADIALADKMIRAEKEFGDMSGFAGLNSPDLERQILEGTGTASAGNFRKSLAKVMATAELRRRGFPIYEDVLDAQLIPELRGHMTGEAGNLIYQPNYKDALIENPVYPHGSYTHGIPRMEGGIIGGFDQTIPINILAHKTFDKKIAEGKTKAQALRSMQTSHWNEHFDQESLDKATKYLENLNKNK